MEEIEIVGQIGSRENPEFEPVDGRVTCQSCYEKEPGACWFWTPIELSPEAIGLECEVCGKLLVEPAPQLTYREAFLLP